MAELFGAPVKDLHLVRLPTEECITINASGARFSPDQGSAFPHGLNNYQTVSKLVSTSELFDSEQTECSNPSLPRQGRPRVRAVNVHRSSTQEGENRRSKLCMAVGAISGATSGFTVKDSLAPGMTER